MTVSLRKMTEADSPYVISWRNADAACFGDGTPLSADQHYRWYHDTYLNDPRDHMYVVMHDDRRAGTIGLYLHDNVNAEIQRVLLGRKDLARKRVMSDALEQVFRIYGMARSYWLKVKPDNIPAIRFYKDNDFIESGWSGEWLTMMR